MTIQADDAQTDQIDTLRCHLAEADAARRHAQEVSSELVKEKRELQAQLADSEKAYQEKARLWIEQTGAVSALQQRVAQLESEVRQGAGETVQTVTTWANETFGQATILAMIKRSRDEFNELLDLIGGCTPDKIAEEAADVCICLYRVIGTLDPEAINKKMKKNRARQWKVDGQGCAQHVGE